MTRSVSREIEINVPVEAVWKALSDAEELTRWFPLDAKIRPGQGGSLWTSWGDEGADEQIEIWEPNKRLRLRAVRGPWNGTATDYRLEGRKGKTVLRVVSSGFDQRDDWKDIVDSFGRGWDFELRGLRHYLERHAGTRRLVARARARHQGPTGEAWARITGPGGWLGSRGLVDLSEGERFAAITATGDALSGTVHTWQPPLQMSGTAEEWNDALLRVQLWGGELTIWLSTYGVSEARVHALERKWSRSLAALSL